jgi:transcriptional regulator with XRE-family HTH domain
MEKPIKEWCRLNGRKMGWLALQSGISFSTLSRIANGKQAPSLAQARAIEDATRHGVTMQTLAKVKYD